MSEILKWLSISIDEKSFNVYANYLSCLFISPPPRNMTIPIMLLTSVNILQIFLQIKKNGHFLCDLNSQNLSWCSQHAILYEGSATCMSASSGHHLQVTESGLVGQ